MGGSGGVFDNSRSSEEYKRLIRETKEKTRDDSYETEVTELINQILYDYNNRDVDIIRMHLDKIKDFIEEMFGGTIELRFGGSVSKHTYVDGLSDIDVLVLINNLDLSSLSPNDVLKKFKIELSNMRFGDINDIHVGKLAVTVTFTDKTQIQFLPAIRREEGFKIPTESGDSWSKIIRPDKFAKSLTEINRLWGGKVIPVVKIVKGINAQLPESHQLKGYHIESMAIEIFRSYPESSPKKTKDMLKYFFEKGKDVIKTPIKDKTGQSINVDEYLGREKSENRLRISNTLDIIYRRMKSADEIGEVSRWERILGVQT